MQKLKLQDLPLEGKKVVMRVDFNVPLDEKGKITDTTRIREALPSIHYILDHGASVILMSHLGRPKAKVDPAFSLKPVAEELAHQLQREVLFVNDCRGPQVQERAAALKPGQVLLLENVRFYSAEEKPEEDPSFAKELASLGDLYVNDAFGTAHRAHTSTATITRYFPGKAAAGFLLQKEITYLHDLLLQPKRPFFALLGGAKVSSKIGVLHALLSKVDGFYIGGGMAYTFLKAHGISIGDSLCEESSLDQAKTFLQECEKRKIPLHLPEDLVIADRFDKEAHSKTVSIQEGVPNGWQGMDIGPKTIESWTATLKRAATLFWNGPMGVFEFPRFAEGTQKIATLIASLPATSVVGGGDSVAAIQQLGLSKKFSHLSTGGGASLEFLECGTLPGIEALTNA